MSIHTPVPCSTKRRRLQEALRRDSREHRRERARDLRARVQELLGHASLESTCGYLHHTHDELERSMLAPERNVLDAAWRRAVRAIGDERDRRAAILNRDITLDGRCSRAHRIAKVGGRSQRPSRSSSA
jgi:hypothetical protein